MQMRITYLFPLLCSVLFYGCVFAEETSEKANILTINNNANDIVVDIQLDRDFYKDFTLDKNRIVAQEVIIKNKLNKWFRFNPIDPDALQSSKGYYSKIWSPDNNYLVLPLGRFEGFAIFSVDYLQSQMKKLITQQYYGTEIIPEKTFKVISEFGPALWHEFIGWENEHILIIRVGLDKDFKEFKYNIQKNKLSGYKHWVGYITQTQLITTNIPAEVR